MSTGPEKRQVPIIDGKSGEVRQSQPVIVQTPYTQPDSPLQRPNLGSNAVARGGADIHQPERTSPNPKSDESAFTETEAKASKSAKPKVEIETFEQFLEYAYRRRGQPAKLDSKVQAVIVKDLSLDERAISKLLVPINADILLAVPRQLLLASKEVSGFPLLRGALTDFVTGVMLRHPAFSSEGVKAAVRNIPGALRPDQALVTLATYTPPEEDGSEPLKPSEVKELRRNATHLLATWFALHRGVNLDDLTNLLFHALWEPAARELADDTDRLRALTEVENSAGVGVAASRYREQLVDARAERDRAMRDAGVLTQQVTTLTAQRDAAEAELADRTAKLDALRVSSTQELEALRAAHSAGRMQQGHEFESLRGRLIQRLEESIDMLETGLNALRKEAETPRVAVMVQRAEVVIDALRSELDSLREV